MLKPEVLRATFHVRASYSASGPDTVVGEVFRLITENCARSDLALKLLAKQMKLSSRHLGRLFQGQAKQTFRHYLRNVRMFRAAELLILEPNDVKVVAALVGYSSRSHFDQDFRAQFGCTPAQFKRATRTA